MQYTNEVMEEDDKQLEGTLKRTIQVDKTNKVVDISILRKRGFSWEKTSIGVIVGGYQFSVFNYGGNLLLEAHPK
jgi:SOS response regulatory protein OraA/RecX